MFLNSLKVAVLAVFLAGAILVVSVDAKVSAFRNLQEGQAPPAFTMKDLGGSDVSLDSSAGKVAVVIFVKPDQKNSQDAMTDLQKIYMKYEKKGVAVLAIVSESTLQNEARRIVTESKITYPVLLDEGRKTYGDWGVFLYPTTAIIGKDGKMSVQVASHNRKFGETVEDNVRVALGEISKEQMDSLLNPKEIEKLTDEQKKAERHMLLAKKLVERKMLDKALAEYAEAVTADPNLVEAKVQYGFLCLKTGDGAKALELFTKAVELNPKSEDAKIGLGAATAAQGEVDKGIEMIQEALKMNPRPAHAHYELGVALEKKGDFKAAAEHYKKSIELTGTW